MSETRFTTLSHSWFRTYVKHPCVSGFIGHVCHEISYVLWVSLESPCKNRCFLNDENT